MHACFTLYFKFQRYFLWKDTRCSYQFFCFLLFYISFYITRYHFLQLFRILFSMIWKKIFAPNLLFLMDSPKTLNGQNPLSVMKIFCQYIFPNTFVIHHCQILLLPGNHQKTKKSDWFAQILLILEVRFWWNQKL